MPALNINIGKAVDLVSGQPDPATRNGDPWTKDPAQADFRIVVLGTSISWGQGLFKHEKFVHLVTRALVNAGVTQNPAILSFAHGGARIWEEPSGGGLSNISLITQMPSDIADADARRSADPNRYNVAVRNDGDGWGECGSLPAHIWHQASEAKKVLGRAKKSADLVLLDAGANDLEVMSIVSSPKDVVKARAANLKDAVKTMLMDFSYQTELQARTIVSGYFAPITKRFNSGNAPGASASTKIPCESFHFNAVAPAVSGFLRKAPQAWIDSSTQMRKSFNVDLLPGEMTRGAVFADPGFTDADGMLAPNTKLWGPDRNGDPFDHALSDRLNLCVPRHTNPFDKIVHTRASFGHPNPAGAELYATAILRAYEAMP